MMTAASGFFSFSHALMGAKASKMGAQTGSSPLFLSWANPMVGVCEHATAPMMLAMSLSPWGRHRASVDVAKARLRELLAHLIDVETELAGGQPRPLGFLVGFARR